MLFKYNSKRESFKGGFTQSIPENTAIVLDNPIPSSNELRTDAVAWTESFKPSRKRSTPNVWSRSALVSKTPPIGELRSEQAAGRSSGLRSICCRKSGEALTKNQGP